MKFTKKLAACLTVLVFALAMSTVAFAADGVDWERGVVRATGVGAGKASFRKEKPGIYRQQAKRAATMDAQRNLAEFAKGVRVTSDSSMRDLELANDNVSSRLDAIISGMSVISENYSEKDGTYEVVLEMPLFGGGGNSLSDAAFLPFKDEPKTDFPAPVNASVASEPTVVNQNYTGLIIDCRGKNLTCVMSPVIMNESNTKIYGHQNLDIDKVISNGMASYASDANDQIARQRAGAKPLIVKAVRLDGNANPVVSVADADKILAANGHDRFLDNCAVVFLK